MTPAPALAPQLVMVAGPNGSGKSTLIAALRADPRVLLPALYINADDLQRERGIADPQRAQRLATELRTQALADGADLMYETVMSHPSKLAELQRAKAVGYHVTVHLVATDDPDINVRRVGARVGAGGHDVPVQRIVDRYTRTLALAPVVLAYADQAVVWDNTLGGDTGRGLTAHAALGGSGLVFTHDQPAGWVRRIAAQVNERAAEVQALAAGVDANLQPLQMAQLDGGCTQGQVVVIGRHYLLQFDEASHATVLHDRTLLGALADSLVVQQKLRLVYREGVAAAEPLQP